MDSEVFTVQMGQLSNGLCGRYWNARCEEEEHEVGPAMEGRRGVGGKYTPNALCVGGKGAFDLLCREGGNVDVEALLKQGVPWGGTKALYDRRPGEEEGGGIANQKKLILREEPDKVVQHHYDVEHSLHAVEGVHIGITTEFLRYQGERAFGLGFC
jgi:hypothetical protein